MFVVAAVLGTQDAGAGGTGGVSGMSGALALRRTGHPGARLVSAPPPSRHRATVVTAAATTHPPAHPPRPIYYVSGRAVALTFDDGPDPRWTPQVLDLLRANHVHATFCVIGTKARAYPYLIRRIVAEGHTLCNHSWDHDERLPWASLAHVRDEMRLANQAIAAASGGVRPTYFRAPGGNWSPAVLAEARAEGMRPLGWSVDPRDWARPGVPHILRTVLAAGSGDIILLHDGGGTRAQTVAALAQALPLLRQRGLAFVRP